MERVEYMLQKMMRRFDARDEHTKELRGDLANIGQKVDGYLVTIKHVEMKLDQLSSIVNPHQRSTLCSNTVRNPKNDGDCMALMTQGLTKPLIHLCRLVLKMM